MKSTIRYNDKSTASGLMKDYYRVAAELKLKKAGHVVMSKIRCSNIEIITQNKHF